MSPPGPGSDAPQPFLGGRVRARLAAVQALYQMEIGGRGAAAVIREFLEHRLADADSAAPAAFEAEFFSAIVEGVVASQARIDPAITAVLAQGWRLERLDATLRALLRAGAYELLERPDVPPRSAISSYVDVAHEFFDGAEPGFVNAALDRLARSARGSEMSPHG